MGMYSARFLAFKHAKTTAVRLQQMLVSPHLPQHSLLLHYSIALSRLGTAGVTRCGHEGISQYMVSQEYPT